jgi:uncharacterized protein (TIGR00369 family)
MSEPPRPPRPLPEQLARYAEQFSRSKTVQYFGVEVSFPDGDHVEVRLPSVRPEHRGGLGGEAVNGGVLAAIFDLVIGCTPALIDPTRRTATMQLSMSFERAVRGNSLRALGQIDSAGQAVLFASASILDASGTVCARCQGVVRLSKLAWQSGESPAVN